VAADDPERTVQLEPMMSPGWSRDPTGNGPAGEQGKGDRQMGKREDAARELERSRDNLRKLQGAGKDTETDRQRVKDAERDYDKASGKDTGRRRGEHK
jgi:hypothetical protein